MKVRISAPVLESRLPVGSSGEDDGGPGDEGAGPGDPLLLPAGHLGRAVPQPGPQPDRVDHPVVPRRLGLLAGDRQRQPDVLRRGQRRQQVVGLEDEADLLAAQQRQLPFGQVAQLRPADPHLAAGDPVQPGQAVHQRRLARAARPHHRREPALGKLDAEAVQGAYLGLALAVDPAHSDRPGCHPAVGIRPGHVRPF